MELCEMIGIVERLKRNGFLSSLKAKAINNAIENQQWRDLVEYGLLLLVPYCEDRELRNEKQGEEA